MKNIFPSVFIASILIMFCNSTNAQSSISFRCKELNINKTLSMKCSPISEDDPKDLAEAWTLLEGFFPADYSGTDQRLTLRFPSKVTSFHWTQSNEDDKNDSLSAIFFYNTNHQTYGYSFQAYAKDFTITITRYNPAKRGIVEGKFEGTMESTLAWTNQTVLIPVKGNFHTVRSEVAWEARKQRVAEKVIVNKAVEIFDETFLAPLQKMGWNIDEEQNGRTAQIANNIIPFRPISFFGSFFNLKLSIDPGSNYGKMLQDSALYYSKQVSQNNNDPKAMAKAAQNMYRILAMQKMEIDIEANSPYIKSEYPMEKNDRFTVLNIPQVAYGCQVYRAPTGNVGTPVEYTYLCFGNWKGADMNANTYVTYPFIHKKQAPVFENIVVVFTGPAQSTNDIISKINWEKLNGAISK